MFELCGASFMTKGIFDNMIARTVSMSGILTFMHEVCNFKFATLLDKLLSLMV